LTQSLERKHLQSEIEVHWTT